MVKASAVAHPIQGLVKYHGLADETLRIPFHDSISVCTAPLSTHTTVEFGDFPLDDALVDGSSPSGGEFQRILTVVDEVRRRAGTKDSFRMVSKNDFPSNVGLGASASGFAALALAASRAAGLDLPAKELSTIARRGAGSATRAVTGGFSLWRRGVSDEDSYAEQLADESLPMAMIIALVPAYKQTDDAHREVLTSPFFQARLAEIPRMLAEMELAIRQRAIGRICELAERDTLMLHGITMTGRSEMLLWRPETVSVMHLVRTLRDEGIPAFFSIDTGATVYVNTTGEHADTVEARVKESGVPTLRCAVGGPARIVDDHLL
jgi:phosphomevalonate decarboxylase